MTTTMIKGITGKISEIATKEKSAAAVGSGLLKVYSTPALVALMEKTASESLQPYLEPHENSVGAEIHVFHTKPTPLGMLVTCKSTIVETDGRKVVFQLKAHDEAGEIGHATHTRYVIDTERFLKKIQ